MSQNFWRIILLFDLQATFFFKNDFISAFDFTGGLVIRPYFWLFIRPHFFSMEKVKIRPFELCSWIFKVQLNICFVDLSWPQFDRTDFKDDLHIVIFVIESAFFILCSILTYLNYKTEMRRRDKFLLYQNLTYSH